MSGKATGNTVVTKIGIQKTNEQVVLKMCLSHRERKRKERKMVDKDIDDNVILLKSEFFM